jgi:hypothetical protein
MVVTDSGGGDVGDTGGVVEDVGDEVRLSVEEVDGTEEEEEDPEAEDVSEEEVGEDDGGEVGLGLSRSGKTFGNQACRY